MSMPSTFSLGGASYVEAPESPVAGRHCAGCAFDRTPNACKIAGPLARDAFGRDCCTDAVIYIAAEKPRASAEEWLRSRYGAYRGHPAWRELEEAYNAGAASNV